MRSQNRRLRAARLAFVLGPSLFLAGSSAGADPARPGRGGLVALRSVVRVFCPAFSSVGSGFLHKSGKVITAAHVVEREIAVESEGGAPPKISFEACPALLVVTPTRGIIPTTATSLDRDLDLALLTIAWPIDEEPLKIASATSFELGAVVSAWGFPVGHNGEVALLTVGNLAGADDLVVAPGKKVRRWVINAAFNNGNSGGPVTDATTGDVIGVVSSKLAPLPDATKAALEALRRTRFGFEYEATKPDGSKEKFYEGQVVASVLDHLRSQVQLVIGQAVLLEHLRGFLAAQGVEP